jgi:hypothetical protein
MNSKVMALLKRLEWRTGRCPECGGWQHPGAAAEKNQAAYPGGHKKDCVLSRMIDGSGE